MDRIWSSNAADEKPPQQIQSPTRNDSRVGNNTGSESSNNGLLITRVAIIGKGKAAIIT